MGLATGGCEHLWMAHRLHTGFTDEVPAAGLGGLSYADSVQGAVAGDLGVLGATLSANVEYSTIVVSWHVVELWEVEVGTSWSCESRHGSQP